MVEPGAPGDAKANIGIGIRRRIVQIQRERPCIRRFVPIAAADETALYICTARRYNIAYGSFLPSFSVAGLMAAISPLAWAKVL